MIHSRAISIHEAVMSAFEYPPEKKYHRLQRTFRGTGIRWNLTSNKTLFVQAHPERLYNQC